MLAVVLVSVEAQGDFIMSHIHDHNVEHLLENIEALFEEIHFILPSGRSVNDVEYFKFNTNSEKFGKFNRILINRGYRMITITDNRYNYYLNSIDFHFLNLN